MRKAESEQDSAGVGGECLVAHTKEMELIVGK